MDYKLLVTDIDGTLLNDKQEISTGNLKALKLLKEKGVHIALCSGRGLSSISSFEEQLGLNTPNAFGVGTPNTFGVGFHGSLIHNSHTKQLVKEFSFSTDIVKELYEISKDFNISILIYKNNKLFTDELTPMTAYYEQVGKIKCEPPIEISELTGDVSKILFTGERSELDLFIKSLPTNINNSCNHFYSATKYYEFISKDAHKGNGLKFLCDKLNIDISKAVSVGDNFNDITLIENAGVGVAVCNAVQPLKNIANYITKNDNNNDAIKEVCEKFFDIKF